jgi:hypothetical protein
MSRTREDLEEEVTRCEEALVKAQRELAAFDARPKGCQCDPWDWGDDVAPVCGAFEPDQDPQFAELCRHCQHPAECHGGGK